MGFGYFGEYLVHRYPWLGPFWMSIVVVWATGWLGGLAMLALRFTHLVRCVRSRSADGWALSDVPLALGHACAMAAPASILLPVPWNDAFYFGWMWAGFFYAVGIAGFAMPARHVRAAGQ